MVVGRVLGRNYGQLAGDAVSRYKTRFSMRRQSIKSYFKDVDYVQWQGVDSVLKRSVQAST